MREHDEINSIACNSESFQMEISFAWSPNREHKSFNVEIGLQILIVYEI